MKKKELEVEIKNLSLTIEAYEGEMETMAQLLSDLLDASAKQDVKLIEQDTIIKYLEAKNA